MMGMIMKEERKKRTHSFNMPLNPESVTIGAFVLEEPSQSTMWSLTNSGVIFS